MSGTFSNVGSNFSFNGAQAKGAADPTDPQDLVTLAYGTANFGGGGAVATDPIWDAKGDLAVGTAADMAARLAVGTADGQVLTVGTAQPLGVYWATPAGGAPSGPAGGVLDGTYPNPGLAASVAGAGLAEASDVLSVNVDGSTLEISTDTLQVKDSGITPTKLSFDPATQTELDNHINDTTDAHDASAISYSPTGSISSTDVQAAIAEVASEAAAASGTPLDGWNATVVTLTFSSADAPTYVCTTGSDLSGTIPVGAKIKLTHAAATKYFFVTAIDATTITLYGGGNTASPSYTLAATAISSVYWSIMKAPMGFPLDPATWTYEVTDTTQRSQASPVNGTWYNLGTISITVPIGCWHVYYEVALELINSSSDTVIAAYSTLSTANNTESDKRFTSTVVTGDANAAGKDISTVVRRENTLTLAAKSQRFLNSMSSSGGSSLLNQNALCTCVIRAVCAYL